jgi:hypothetical protein
MLSPISVQYGKFAQRYSGLEFTLHAPAAPQGDGGGVLLLCLFVVSHARSFSQRGMALKRHL